MSLCAGNKVSVQGTKEEAGLIVDAATDGIQAVDKCRGGRYSLILMDMQMPNLSGVQATKRIRQMPVYRKTPIIAMTANAFAEDKASCFSAGMSDFIAKPFKPNALFFKVHKWLEQEAHPTEMGSILQIGMPLIDGEHADLLWQLDTLAESRNLYPRDEDFLDALDQLANQIREHFTNEERILESLAMPPDLVQRHVCAHNAILEEYARLNFDLMQGKALSRSDVLFMIKAWIVQHLSDYDQRIKEFLPKDLSVIATE